MGNIFMFILNSNQNLIFLHWEFLFLSYKNRFPLLKPVFYTEFQQTSAVC